MNANKLHKMLQRGADSFKSLGSYKKILEQTARIALDFSDFNGFELLADKAWASAKENGLKLPFESVLLDVTGVDLPSIHNGKLQKQNLMLHIVPVEVSTDISTFKIMLVQDMRVVGKDIYPRSHVISLDDKEIYSMPAVDDGTMTLGCKCSMKNPLSQGLIFKQLQSFTPGFKGDCGFACADCPSNLQICKQLQQSSKDVTRVALAGMFYMNLTCHQTIKITDINGRPQNGLHQMPNYAVCDEQMWKRMSSGTTMGRNALNDMAKFDELSKIEFVMPQPVQTNAHKLEPVTT